jgi:acid stress-induced BolA-like protein IbaG/YrbA
MSIALVTSFYEALGYENFTEIKYQWDKIDIAILIKEKILIVTEVKRKWNIFDNMKAALKQAYLYALSITEISE